MPPSTPGLQNATIEFDRLRGVQNASIEFARLRGIRSTSIEFARVRGIRSASIEFEAPFCTDGICDAGEVCTCPADCGTPPSSEVPGSTCADGLDNDCDELIDCDDLDCDPACGDIPTVSAWGLFVLTLLLVTGAKVYFSRRRLTADSV